MSWVCGIAGEPGFLVTAPCLTRLSLSSRRHPQDTWRPNWRFFCMCPSKTPCASRSEPVVCIARISMAAIFTWPKSALAIRNSPQPAMLINPIWILTKKSIVRPASSFTACWMNNNVDSMPDWKVSRKAMAGTANWLKLWDSTLKQ